MKDPRLKYISFYRLFTVCLFLQFSCLPLFGQKDIDDHVHGWVVYQGNHKLNDKFALHTEYQWRRANGFTDWQQSLLRFGLDYKLNPNCILSGGYGWIVSFPYGNQPIPAQTNENRLWQQVELKQNMGKLQLQHRYRLEQRCVEMQFKQRFRYRAQIIIPLQVANSHHNKGFFLNVNNEIFLGFGTGVEKNILDQNRFICASGYHLTKNFSVQIGYLNQLIIKANAEQMERNHTLWTAIVYNLDFSK